MISWSRQKVFQLVHSNNLVYNQCWEDPRLDHEALQIKKNDNLLVITSAGCNVLDYLLKSPNRIDSVDMNPRQNALLELKLSGLQNLNYSDFFTLFAQGHHPHLLELYQQKLRGALSSYSQQYWTKTFIFLRPTVGGLHFIIAAVRALLPGL